MPLIEMDDLGPGVLPAYLNREHRELIEVAILMGWKLHISSANSCTIISYDERKKYHFSVTGRASIPMSRMRKDVFRNARPDLLMIADSAEGIKNKQIRQQLIDALPHVGQEGTVVDHRPEIEKEAEAERMAKAAAREERERQEQSEQAAKKAVPRPPAKKAAVKAVPALLDKPDHGHILSEKPMLAKASEGKGYESRIATERLWSDGHTDYKCVDCDYSSDNRLAIRGHRSGAGHGKKGGEEPARFDTEVPKAVVYNPRQDRVDALAQVIGLMFEEGADPQGIARAALVWVKEQAKKGTALAEERDTDGREDILARIRTLVDDGSMLRMQQHVDALEERLVAAEQRAEQSQNNLRAFRELVSELEES